MLPDIPRTKEEVFLLLQQATAEAAKNARPLLKSIQVEIVHEGHETTTRTTDGHVQRRGMKKAETRLTVDLTKVPSQGLETTARMLREATDRLQDAQAKLLFEEVERATKLAGTVVSAQGTPLSANLLLDALERMEIDFDDDGNPIYPTLVISPALEKQVTLLSEQMENDPAVQSRHDAIMVRKKAEWFDRENNRKLVD